MLAEAVRDAGAIGTLINHSVQRLTLAEIDAAIQAARRTGIATIVCSNNIATTKAAAALKPDFVAIEPLELIGTGIPVSTADPEIVSGAVDAARGIDPDVMVLCGAGISKKEMGTNPYSVDSDADESCYAVYSVCNASGYEI